MSLMDANPPLIAAKTSWRWRPLVPLCMRDPSFRVAWVKVDNTGQVWSIKSTTILSLACQIDSKLTLVLQIDIKSKVFFHKSARNSKFEGEHTHLTAYRLVLRTMAVNFIGVTYPQLAASRRDFGLKFIDFSDIKNDKMSIEDTEHS